MVLVETSEDDSFLLVAQHIANLLNDGQVLELLEPPALLWDTDQLRSSSAPHKPLTFLSFAANDSASRDPWFPIPRRVHSNFDRAGKPP